MLVGCDALVELRAHRAFVRCVSSRRLGLRDLSGEIGLRIGHVRSTLHVPEFLLGGIEISGVKCLDAVGEAIVVASILARNFLPHDVAVLLGIFVAGVFLSRRTVQTRRLGDVSLPCRGLCGFVVIVLLAGEGRKCGEDEGECECYVGKFSHGQLVSMICFSTSMGSKTDFTAPGESLVALTFSVLSVPSRPVSTTS